MSPQDSQEKKWFYTINRKESVTRHLDGTIDTHTYTKNTPNIPHIVLTAVAGIVLLTILFSMPRTVKVGEVGLVTRFGKVVRVAEPGLTIKLPLVEGMTHMETRVQKQEVKTDAATKDLQEVNGALALNFTLTNENALKVYRELGTSYAATVITPILHESFKQGVSRYTAEELMANRTDVKTSIQETLTQRLEGYGITVVDANITDLNFSAEFNKAIEEKAVAQQQVEKAQRDLDRVRVESDAKVEAARAEAEAQRLQQETLSELMIKKLMIEKWNGDVPEVVSDSAILRELGL